MKKTLLLLLLCLVQLALPQMARAVDKTTLYAVVMGKGIYAFDPQDVNAEPVLVLSDDNYGYMQHANTVMAYGDNTLYSYRYRENRQTGELMDVRFYKFRRAADGSWSCDNPIDLEKKYDVFPHTFTYDPYTKKLYGFRRGATHVLYEINPDNGAMTPVATGCTNAYNCMVAASNGTLYTMGEINEEEYLFIKDKSSIKHTMIAGYNNLLSDDILLASFAGNNNDDNLYVLNRNEKTIIEDENGTHNQINWDGNGLYSIDMKHLDYNKNAKKIGNVFAGQKILGFFAITEEVAAAQLPPAAVEGLKVEFASAGQTAATISATAPVRLMDGTTVMETPADISFYIDDRLIGQKQGVNPGKTASVSYDFVNEGAYVVRAVASNENGEGPATLVETYAGFDTPDVVTDVRLAIDATGHYTLTWTAPACGEHGGMYDAANVEYDVTLYPGGKTQTVTGVSLEGTIESQLFSDYYFTVTAKVGSKVGKSVTSNHAQYGEAIELPYLEDFSDEATWGRHTIWNVNGDATWIRGYSVVDGLMACYDGVNCKNQADDWLITPPMKMHANTTYTVRFKVYNNQFMSSLPTPLKVYESPTNHPENYADQPENHMELIGNPTVKAFDAPVFAEYTFENKEEGIRYFAFHTTAYAGTRLWIENYSIIPGASKAAPADVTRLKVTPDEEGAIRTTISFVAPTTTMDDSELYGIDYISIYRDGDLNEIHRFLKPAPGAELTYVDEAEDLTNDNHEYKVKCFNVNGASEGIARTVLVGQDYASAPLNLKVTDKGDYYLLTWDRPNSSVYGGYVNFDEVKFWLMVGSADGEGNPYTLEDAYDGTSYEIEKSLIRRLGMRADQLVVNFWCISATPRGSHINGSVSYTSAVYGTPWDIPFNEGIAHSEIQGTYLTTYPWSIVTYEPYASAHVDPWYIVSDTSSKLPISVSDHDGTGAMFMWYQTAGTVFESYFLTPQIAFSQAKQPTLTFWLWHNNGVPSPAENWLKIYACASSNEYIPIEGFETISIADGQPNGWRRHVVDLSNVDCNGGVYRLAFHGRGEAGVCYYIDDVVVDDSYVDGINTVLRPEASDAPVYDLAGRRLSGNAQGIRVANGLKVLK